jgi:hypothetical protein
LATEQPRIKKRVVKKPDGRYLIYFDKAMAVKPKATA